MALRTAQISVGTTAVPLTTSSDPTDYAAGNSLVLLNVGAVDCVLGDSTVTAATGFALKAGAGISLDLADGDVAYARTASSTTTLHVMAVK